MHRKGYSCHSGGEVINLRPPAVEAGGEFRSQGKPETAADELAGFMPWSAASLTGACPRVGPQRLISGPRVELLSQAWLSIGLPLLEPGHGAPSGSGGGQVRVKPR
ncbi:hypothetical protein SRHO_G00307250 [Serrasalmus rhombeus]